MARTKVRGVPALQRQFRDISKGVGRAAFFGAREGAEVVAAEARMRAPVDTGELRDAITVEMTRVWLWRYEASVVVDTSAIRGDFHPIYIEFGTSKMEARPFLAPAFELTQNVATARIASRVARFLDGV